jgi:hypothetical protein
MRREPQQRCSKAWTFLRRLSILVEGNELTRLMMQYGVGVRTERIIELKRIPETPICNAPFRYDADCDRNKPAVQPFFGVERVITPTNVKTAPLSVSCCIAQ